MVNLRKTAYSPRIADWDRESSLKSFYSRVQKSVSSQHKLVHLSPTRLDPLIMGANPPKNDRYMFQQFGVMELWSEQDSKLAEEMNLGFVPLFQVTSMFSGLSCDGMHHSPIRYHHVHGMEWHCRPFYQVYVVALQMFFFKLLKGVTLQIVERSNNRGYNSGATT